MLRKIWSKIGVQIHLYPLKISLNAIVYTAALPLYCNVCSQQYLWWAGLRWANGGAAKGRAAGRAPRADKARGDVYKAGGSWGVSKAGVAAKVEDDTKAPCWQGQTY